MKIVVIGNGMVGLKFCERLLADKNRSFEIVVLGEETLPAYDRVHLTDYISGKTAAELSLKPLDWYREQNIRLCLDEPVIRIDRENKQVHTKYNRLAYDYLVIATGSAPFRPKISGIGKQGVFFYRTIQDLDQIRNYARSARTAAVLGGGLLGLEAAKALLDLGVADPHVIEFSPRLMPRQIDEAGSQVLAGKLRSLGLTIYTGKELVEINGLDKIQSLSFADETELPTDMLVVSAGIQPRDELARAAGLQTGTRGGIAVNEKMQTSDPSIFAIGECALFEERIYGLVAPGYEMATVAAAVISQKEKSFTGFDMSTKLKLVGVDVASFGLPFADDNAYRSVIFENKVTGVYKRLTLSQDGKQLLGGILIGDADAYNMLLQATINRLAIPERAEEILFTPAAGKTIHQNGVTHLPDESVICSCEQISRIQICDAVQHKGCESPEAIKKCTGAGTGCGGCMPLVKDLVEYKLKELGKYVKRNVCEHFGYSRQELFDLIKLKNLRTYDEALDLLGKGDGCELCRPLVSSLLASIWNDMILKNGNDTAQDSNDRYLANIQKGGSYSVVPRIPGGEITPDKLIVIGEVAKKYQLYTKITGGQRIDMFGAHLNDLPYIWEELINAGFESGHAYGKALRTVKSCVGSTWCRFGLHDSVSFAIRIEERYRGLRAPHKIKSAVSGCIRECAEAQSKDFGIIATEKGWNLYVCGNGGSKPQHAILLASDVDSETCIRYIDRFLMFYIKTGDPLTRTATWLNKMEGGIDYLRNVIINDSLNIAEELEAEMQQLVDSYACEWKAVVNSPELRKKFAHFVNDPKAKDPSVQFEPLRGQKKAMEWK